MSDGTATIPQHALARLQGLRRDGHPGGIFTSDFTVNEFLLVRKAGFEPVGLCVGSCIYHLGFQFAGWSSSVELETLSTAMYEARGSNGTARCWNSSRSARASSMRAGRRRSRARTGSHSPPR